MVVSPAQRPHVAHFYDGEDTYYRKLVPFVASGLRAGDAVILILTAEHLERLRAELDIEPAPGQLVTVDADELLGQLLVDGMPDRGRFLAQVGSLMDGVLAAFSRVRAVGEMVDVLAADGRVQAAQRLEVLWNQLLMGAPVTLWCFYHIERFRLAESSTAFHAVCALHTDVHPSHDPDPTAPRRLVAQLEQQAAALRGEVEERRAAEEHTRRLYRELQDAVRRQEDADRRKDEFLAMLGHELRNPLAPILTALELMKLRSDVGADRERGVIERQARHLVRLVDDLMDISRITRGKVQLRRHPVEVAQVLAKAVETASPLLEERQHALEIDVPPNGLVIDADQDRMAQVVANLLTNAARYTPVGGHVRLRAARDSGEVVITVEDDGIGIRPELLPRLFELFVQGERTFDRSEGGLGIGLTLARSLTEMHGGTVSAASDGPGKGSRFTVKMPLVNAERPIADAALPPRDAVPRKLRILVVDDNEDAAVTLADLLEEVGHQVEVAHDGPAALARAAAFAPEVVLLDLGLPVMDGFEVARRLRAQTDRPLRIIALSGYGQECDRARTAAAGFDVHLVKPVDLDVLEAAVESR